MLPVPLTRRKVYARDHYQYRYENVRHPFLKSQDPARLKMSNPYGSCERFHVELHCSHVARIVEQDIPALADAYRPDTLDAAKLNTIDGCISSALCCFCLLTVKLYFL